MQPAHPINTKMAVPIVSLRAMVNISQPLTVSSVKLFKPGTNKKKKKQIYDFLSSKVEFDLAIKKFL